MVDDRKSERAAPSRRAVVAGCAAQSVGGSARGGDGYDAVLFESNAARRAYPRASASTPDLTEDGAYALQAAYVRRVLRDDGMAGIKGGVMTPAARKQLGVGPVTGVLFTSGRVAPGATLTASDFRRLMVEVEVGFETAQAIAAPVADVASLRRYVASVRPCMEFPDDGFAERGFGGPDLIAANVLSRAFMAGPPAKVGDSLASLEVQVFRDDAPVHRGPATDAYPEPWEALRRLVNDSTHRRGPLAAGSLVITGALGGAFRGVPGRYRAEFGPLGALDFTITA